jgi:hypothetical protein
VGELRRKPGHAGRAAAPFLTHSRASPNPPHPPRSIAILLFSTVVYYAERGTWDSATQTWYRDASYGVDELGGPLPSPFTSIPATFWWCMVTMTTVGFGDVVPVTGLGKAIASFTFISGVMLLAIPISVISGNFHGEYAHMRRLQMLKAEHARQGPPQPLDPGAAAGEAAADTAAVASAAEAAAGALRRPAAGMGAGGVGGADAAGGLGLDGLGSPPKAGEGEVDRGAGVGFTVSSSAATAGGGLLALPSLARQSSGGAAVPSSPALHSMPGGLQGISVAAPLAAKLSSAAYRTAAQDDMISRAEIELARAGAMVRQPSEADLMAMLAQGEGASGAAGRGREGGSSGGVGAGGGGGEGGLDALGFPRKRTSSRAVGEGEEEGPDAEGRRARMGRSRSGSVATGLVAGAGGSGGGRARANSRGGGRMGASPFMSPQAGPSSELDVVPELSLAGAPLPGGSPLPPLPALTPPGAAPALPSSSPGGGPLSGGRAIQWHSSMRTTSLGEEGEDGDEYYDEDEEEEYGEFGGEGATEAERMAAAALAEHLGGPLFATPARSRAAAGFGGGVGGGEEGAGWPTPARRLNPTASAADFFNPTGLVGDGAVPAGLVDEFLGVGDEDGEGEEGGLTEAEAILEAQRRIDASWSEPFLRTVLNIVRNSR